MTFLPKGSQVPLSLTGKVMWAVALGWVLVAVGLLLRERVAPSPTATIRRDFTLACGWITDYRAEHGTIPSQECFQRFLLRSAFTVPIDYEPTGSDTYSLKGWDGENMWMLSPDNGNFVLIDH